MKNEPCWLSGVLGEPRVWQTSPSGNMCCENQQYVQTEWTSPTPHARPPDTFHLAAAHACQRRRLRQQGTSICRRAEIRVRRRCFTPWGLDGGWRRCRGALVHSGKGLAINSRSAEATYRRREISTRHKMVTFTVMMKLIFREIFRPLQGAK